MIYAQNHRTFPNVSAIFTEDWPCQDATYGPWTMSLYYTYSAEPTVQFQGLDWGEFGNGGGNEFIAVSGQQVLYRSTVGLQDTVIVLYDFSLNVGDTAYYDQYYDFGFAVVQSTDTVDLNGHTRKRLFLSNEDVWVEGIGSLEGIYRPFWTTPLGCVDPVYTFCGNYIDDDQVPYTICTDLLLDIPIPDKQLFSIAPNPTTGEFLILGTLSNEAYQIRDVAGRVVLNGITTEKRTQIEQSHLIAGTYFVVLGQATLKLIVE
ncbi:MAG: T9SS type A sorting domain-containing protein [Flavobacteriales bacterium]